MTNPMPGRQRIATPNGSGQQQPAQRIPLIEAPRRVETAGGEKITVPAQINLSKVRRAQPADPDGDGGYGYVEVVYEDGTTDLLDLDYREYQHLCAAVGAPAIGNQERSYPDLGWAD